MEVEWESVGKQVMEKLKELVLLLWNFGGYLLGKFNEVFPPETREEKLHHWQKHVMEKLKELLLLTENFGRYLLGKFDEVFPPETREEMLHHLVSVGVPVGLTMALLLLCFWCCCGCCKRKVKTMKAPGRNSRMPRHDFENSPRSYFQNLRGN